MLSSSIYMTEKPVRIDIFILLDYISLKCQYAYPNKKKYDSPGNGEIHRIQAKGDFR